MVDSRPDLTGDSQEWTRLLSMAGGVDLELAGILHGMRCCGLRLVREAEGYSLRPEFNKDSKWSNEAEYMADRNKWLVPYGKELVELLNRL